MTIKGWYCFVAIIRTVQFLGFFHFKCVPIGRMLWVLDKRDLLTKVWSKLSELNSVKSLRDSFRLGSNFQTQNAAHCFAQFAKKLATVSDFWRLVAQNRHLQRSFKNVLQLDVRVENYNDDRQNTATVGSVTKLKMLGQQKIITRSTLNRDGKRVVRRLLSSFYI